MSEPIAPRMYVDKVYIKTIGINYNPVWNGADWVLTPADIRVFGNGALADGTTGEEITSGDITVHAPDLPPAGQTALNELLQYMEQALAAQYT